MKFHYKAPVKHVLVVKPDKDAEEYTVWVLSPVCVGEVRKVGDKRMEANGHHYTNVNAAVRALLEERGEPALAEEVSPYMRISRREVLQVLGTEMLERDVWKKFCEARKLKVSDVKALQKKYGLTQEEAKELGLV